jgi:hypothetical protein
VNRNSQRGVALIVVLLTCSVLTALATLITVRSMAARRVTHSMGVELQQNAIVDSALNITLAALVSPQPASAGVTLGTSQAISVLGQVVDVTIELERSRVDLSLATAELIALALQDQGIEEQQAALMTRQLLGLPDRSLKTVEEVRLVPGWKDLKPEQLDAFTVYTHAERPSGVGVRPNIAKWLQEKHGEVTDSRASPIRESALAGELLRLNACMAKQQGRRCWRTIVRVTGSINTPIQVFEWRAQQPSVRVAGSRGT